MRYKNYCYLTPAICPQPSCNQTEKQKCKIMFLSNTANLLFSLVSQNKNMKEDSKSREWF